MRCHGSPPRTGTSGNAACGSDARGGGLMGHVRRLWSVGAALAVVATATGRMSADDTTETIHLVVIGGAFAGTYDATSTAGGCKAGANGSGSWGNELLVRGVTNPKALASFPLIVPS